MDSARKENAYKALADGQRRRVLRLLRDGESDAGSLARKVGITPATISHHLNILRNAGLVRVRREGQRRVYELNTSVVEEVLLLVSDLLQTRKGA